MVKLGDVKPYLEWLNDLVNDRRATLSPLSEAHQDMAPVLRDGLFSFDEVITLLAGLASMYCNDRIDAKAASDGFYDAIMEIVGFKDDEPEIDDDFDEEVEGLKW